MLDSEAVETAIKLTGHKRLEWLASENNLDIEGRKGAIRLARKWIGEEIPEPAKPCCGEHTLPPIRQQINNFVAAVVEADKSAYSTVSPTTAAQRLAICNSCEFMRGSRCTLCGCGIQGKTALSISSCPANPQRWTKDELLVVASYNESLEWLAPLQIPTLVFTKGPSKPPMRERLETFPLENIGNEGHTWLYYVTNYYDNLPAKVSFSQGNPFVHSEDFLDRLKIWDRRPFTLTTRYTEEWPSPQVTFHDKISGVGGKQVRYGNGLYYGLGGIDVNGAWLKAMWREVFGDIPIPSPWWYGYGAMYSVPREFILRRPKSFYQRLLEIMSGESGSSRQVYEHVISGWALEALWYYIWGVEDHAYG